MKDNPSNINMERELEKLRSIRSVDAPDSLYYKVMNRVQEKTIQLVPKSWFAIAAAVIIGIIVADIYAMKDNTDQQTSELMELVPSSSNQLYYD